jgi:hypothetical protein
MTYLRTKPTKCYGCTFAHNTPDGWECGYSGELVEKEKFCVRKSFEAQTSKPHRQYRGEK